MTRFRDIPINALFSFPDPAPASGIARLGLCVKISARRYQALGQPTIYTIGRVVAEVAARGELETVTATARRGSRRAL